MNPEKTMSQICLRQNMEACYLYIVAIEQLLNDSSQTVFDVG